MSSIRTISRSGRRRRDPAWATSNDLDESTFTRFVHRLARVRALMDEGAGDCKSREGERRCLIALLRAHGEYERFRAGRAARRARGDTAVLCNLELRDGENLMLLRRMAKLWQLVDRAAEARGVGTDGLHDDELQDFADDFRAARGLETRAATRAWLRHNDLDVAGFDELVTAWARLHILFHNAQTDTLGVAESRGRHLLVPRRAPAHRILYSLKGKPCRRRVWKCHSPKRHRRAHTQKTALNVGRPRTQRCSGAFPLRANAPSSFVEGQPQQREKTPPRLLKGFRCQGGRAGMLRCAPLVSVMKTTDFGDRYDRTR